MNKTIFRLSDTIVKSVEIGYEIAITLSKVDDEKYMKPHTMWLPLADFSRWFCEYRKCEAWHIPASLYLTNPVRGGRTQDVQASDIIEYLKRYTEPLSKEEYKRLPKYRKADYDSYRFEYRAEVSAPEMGKAELAMKEEIFTMTPGESFPAKFK